MKKRPWKHHIQALCLCLLDPGLWLRGITPSRTSSRPSCYAHPRNASLCLNSTPLQPMWPVWSPLPKAPNQQYQDDQTKRSKRPVLLQQQLPVDPDGRALVLRTILPQPRAQVAHLLQAVASIQQVLDVLCHHLRHIFQLVIQPGQVVCGATVLVRLLRAVDVALELGELVGSQGGR